MQSLLPCYPAGMRVGERSGGTVGEQAGAVKHFGSNELEETLVGELVVGKLVVREKRWANRRDTHLPCTGFRFSTSMTVLDDSFFRLHVSVF